jgi:hypothetical protein
MLAEALEDEVGRVGLMIRGEGDDLKLGVVGRNHDH